MLVELLAGALWAAAASDFSSARNAVLAAGAAPGVVAAGAAAAGAAAAGADAAGVETALPSRRR